MRSMSLKILLTITFLTSAKCLDTDTSWSWYCIDGNCVKKQPGDPAPENEIRYTHDVCRLICGRYGPILPQPTGNTILGTTVVEFHPHRITFNYSDVIPKSPEVKKYLREVSEMFRKRLLVDCGNNCAMVEGRNVTISFKVTSSNLTIDWDTNESYFLDVSTSVIEDRIDVTIISKTVFGARHALETLSQLTATFTWSSLKSLPKHLVMVSSVSISDAPFYSHRGLMLDTSRNFISVPAILRTLDAMSMTKLNVFHWHLTDSHSFPLEVSAVSEMTKYGAYSADQVYRSNEIRYIIEYARLRGIRVVFEIDMPAHAGNGWQWGETQNLGSLAVCVNAQPWRQYCIQPPCGQLNPANPNVYTILEKIFEFIILETPPGEVIHMGGDEVFFPCWDSAQEISSWMEENEIPRTKEGFLQVWSYFQNSTLETFDKVNPVKNVSTILWSSELTDPNHIEKYLDKNRYVIEMWVSADSTIPMELLKKGYKLIMATKDKWYLDHGFWGRTVYHKWNEVYDNKLPDHPNVLGGEAAMWTEFTDDYSMDMKVWPRAAAAAERLWTNPDTSFLDAKSRMLHFRQRLIRKGINADSISPFYCYQNEGECN